MEPLEPPRTPEEQAQLERAVADMLEGREPPSRWINLSKFFGRVLRPSVTQPKDLDR